jgi:hypothetical protein
VPRFYYADDKYMTGHLSGNFNNIKLYKD